MAGDAKNPSDAQAALLKRYEAADDPASAQPRGVAGVAESTSEGEGSAAPASSAPESSYPAVVAGVAPRHPASVLKQAKRWNISEDDLESEDTETIREMIAERRSAEHTVNALKVVLNSSGQPYNPANGQLLPRDTPVGTPIPSSGGVTASTQPAGVPSSEQLTLGVTAQDFENAGYDAGLHAIIEKAIRPILATVERLQTENAELIRSEMGRRGRDGMNAADKQFNRFPKVYGEGTLDDLDPESREFKRRMNVIDKMRVTAASGKGFRHDFDQAHDALYGDFQPPAAAATNPRDTMPPGPAATQPARPGDKFRNGHVARPSESQPPRPKRKGTAAAEEAVEAILKQRAADVDPSAETDEDTLPD